MPGSGSVRTVGAAGAGGRVCARAAGAGGAEGFLDGGGAGRQGCPGRDAAAAGHGYVIPRIGGLRLQDVRPATIGQLYRDLLTAGGRNGRPLSPRTVEHVHRTLRCEPCGVRHVLKLTTGTSAQPGVLREP